MNRKEQKDQIGGEAGGPRVVAVTPRWLVLDKPPGWLTIPGRNSRERVVSEWAAEHHGPIWVVHRLDRGTSGVLLLARSAEAHREAGLWFQRHEVRKQYDCLAQGRPAAPMLRLKGPVRGVASVTQLEVRRRYEPWGCFRGRAVPLTGRRHQIRIHLAGEGHPLLGDPQYGGPEAVSRTDGGARLEIGRVALHSARLELPSGEVFEAPLPEDFAAWVEALGGGDA